MAAMCTPAAAALFRLTLSQGAPEIPGSRMPVAWLSTDVLLEDLSWPFVVSVFIISLAVVISAANALTFVFRLAIRPAPVGLQIHRTHAVMPWLFHDWDRQAVTVGGLGCI
ncbi:MAG: hypothetical protein ACYCZF_03870 [Anaerolineae bacterium]